MEHDLFNSKLKPMVWRSIKVLGVRAVLWVFACGALYGVMLQPPDTFGRFMAKVPGPVAFLVLPFETLWTRARAGELHVGDLAPDFDLAACTGDREHRVKLSEYRGKTNVVIVFHPLDWTPT